MSPILIEILCTVSLSSKATYLSLSVKNIIICSTYLRPSVKKSVDALGLNCHLVSIKQSSNPYTLYYLFVSGKERTSI